jgi:hypothetical protein
MINAPITPGTQATSVRRNTITIEPHPLSNTASGGKNMQSATRQQDMRSSSVEQEARYF